MATSTTRPAAGCDIVAYRGDTFERWVRIRRNGVEEDLQPSTFVMQIRAGSEIINEISTTNTPSGSILIDSPNRGVLHIAISASRMAAIEPGAYVYDMQQTYPAPDSKVKTRFQGTFTIIDDITKLPS